MKDNDTGKGRESDSECKYREVNRHVKLTTGHGEKRLQNDETDNNQTFCIQVVEAISVLLLGLLHGIIFPYAYVDLVISIKKHSYNVAVVTNKSVVPSFYYAKYNTFICREIVPKSAFFLPKTIDLCKSNIVYLHYDTLMTLLWRKLGHACTHYCVPAITIGKQKEEIPIALHLLLLLSRSAVISYP